MLPPYPGPREDTLDCVWRFKLSEAERQYVEHRTSENRAEFLRVLHQFSSLAMRGVIPREADIPTWSGR
jgi:hypothetical protein